MPKFVPRQRKHKARERERQNGGNTTAVGDSNAVEILPASKAEREERRQKLKEELRAQQPKISSKKQKRLDKYIDTKLRKEENLELIKKLAQHKVDTSLLRSSKQLGRVTESKRETLSRALQERRAGIDVAENDKLLLEERTNQASGSENESDPDYAPPETDSRVQETVQPKPAPIAFGSGLKRPLDVDEEGRPIITVKRRKKDKGRSATFEPPAEIEWEGFSTESEAGSLSQEDAESDMEGGSESASESDNDPSSDGTSADEESSSEEEVDTEARKARTSAFKAWASQQRNEALGFVPSADQPIELPQRNGTTDSVPEFKPRPMEVDPLPPELAFNTANTARKAYSVNVERSPEVQEARLKLPIVAEEQKIMEAIHNNDVVVIWGDTGSGKTTQVPQFLYEAGYGDPNGPTPGMIGVTQPRRVAAVSMSKRVDDELGNAKGKVSYQIRFDSSVSSKTAIKFMTDGVLLREIAQDFALKKYSVVIIDEAHERNINTDILIGMMSRIVDLRADMAAKDPKNHKPLKLVIMSATLRISDFTNNQRLFRKGPPPLVQAEGRQYPVQMHFARRTQHDYVEQAFSWISRGHQKLPKGGMLVFLTGQNEITTLARRLRQKFSNSQDGVAHNARVSVSAAEAPLEVEDIELSNPRHVEENLDESDSEAEFHGLDEDEDRELDIEEENTDEGADVIPVGPKIPSKVHVLPLYSQLPTNQQLRVFEPLPDGSRLIVLATNVAETSLTIPGIRYVFDCGRAKERQYDRTTGVQSFEVGWISKASAKQRAGRAGRTESGHCYRLYSSAVYERDFEEYAEPEILRMPIEGVVLQLKSMDLQHVINFPFPTPPDRQSLAKAEKLLMYLGALSPDGKITESGRQLALYPLSPRFSRMLFIGQNQGSKDNVIAYTIALVAALAVPDLIIPENQTNVTDGTVDGEDSDNSQPGQEINNNHKAHARAMHTLSRWDRQTDALKLLTALCAYAWSSNPTDFCATTFLRPKALREASQLREQLTSILRATNPTRIGPYEAKLPSPSKTALATLKQILAAGFIDQVALRADLAPAPPELLRKPRRAIDVPYITLFRSHDRRDDDEPYVYLHPASVLADTKPAALPQYLVYSHLQRSASSTTGGGGKGKVRMHALTPVTGGQLTVLANGTPLLEWGKPVGRVTVLERVDGKERRKCVVVPSVVGEKGGLGWPLPAREVVQRREEGRGWVFEGFVGKV